MHSGQQYNIACEPVPFDWISDGVLVQRFNALRLVSLVQLVYAILAYVSAFMLARDEGLGINFSNWSNICQGVGGISILTIIAAIVMRLRFDSEKSKLQVKIYLGLIVADMLAWSARIGYNIYFLDKNYWEFPVHDFLTSSVPNFFVFILLLVGLSVAAKVLHRANAQQYSLLSDGRDDSPASRAVINFYPLRIISFIQLVYTVAAFVMVFEPEADQYDFTTLILTIPAAGALTIVSTLMTFFCASMGKPLLTYYAMLQAIDMVTGLCRVVAGILYVILWVNKDSNDAVDLDLIIMTAIWTAFPLFYWLLGIITAYRTRVSIDADAFFNTEDSDRVYGI